MAAPRRDASALLPADALIAIASRLLPSANDLSAMAATCSTWRSLLLHSSSPSLHIHTLHFLQSNSTSFTSFTQAIARSFPSTAPLKHLHISFCSGSSHGAIFTWLAHHSLLETLSLAEQAFGTAKTPLCTLARDNWRVLGSLNHLSSLALHNYMVDLDSRLILEGDELEEDVRNNRSGIKLAPHNENIQLSQLRILTLMGCDIDFGGLAVLLEYYCTPQDLTLHFPFDELTRAEPHSHTMILDVYGPCLKYFNTVGPSIPHPHVLYLKAAAIESVVVHNYERVQFDLDSSSLQSLTVRSSMELYFERAIPLLHHLSVQGEDWANEDLLGLFEMCTHVKAMHLDFSSCDDDDLEIEFLHTFVHLQSLFLGSTTLKIWARQPWRGPLQLPTLQSLKLQEVMTKFELELLRRLLEAAPSLKTLIICEVEEETLGYVKALLSQYPEVEHSFGSEIL